MKIKTILGIALAVGSLASCSVEDNESSADSVKENYTREFIKQFGTINPNQDWSVAEQKSITVDLPKASHVQIFEKQGDEFRLAADYEGVTKKTITFDGLEGDDTPFIVYVDDAKFAVDNGGTLAISSDALSGAKRTSKIPDGTDWITRAKDQTKIVLSSTDETMKKLAEGNGQNLVEQGVVETVPSGSAGIISPNKPFTLYPMYWNSKKKHVVGIYYYEGFNLTRVPVYVDKEGDSQDDLSFYPALLDRVWGYAPKAYPAETDAEDCWAYTHTNTPGAITGWDSKWNVKFIDNKKFQFSSRGYTVTTKASLWAGIYVEVDGNYYYSDPKLNDGKKFFADHVVKDGDGTDKTAYSYICFDDPDDSCNEGDRDFNDLVIYIPQELTHTSNKEVEWTIACEDLGGAYDYDFNDLVFRMTHTAGKDVAHIFPVAAGGTLSAQLFFNDKPISEEWHSHFGKGHEPNVMINTGKGPEEHAMKMIHLSDMDEDWSITQFGNNANGLSIRVTRADGSVVSVVGPKKGEAPQMLILPYDWQWPTEQTRITTAYPDFGTWGENYQSSSWVDNKDAKSVITGFGEMEITGNGEKKYSVK